VEGGEGFLPKTESKTLCTKSATKSPFFGADDSPDEDDEDEDEEEEEEEEETNSSISSSDSSLVIVANFDSVANSK
jgi:hypothetical protein